MNMKRLLTLVAFFATVQASAQQVNPVPDYVFRNQMSVGRNAVTDTAAYFSIGPRYGATKGFMPPIVGDTATFSSGKRNGLLIFSVQKNKFLYWDSVRVQWADMAGGSGSYILAGDTSAMLLPYVRHAGYGLTKDGQSFLVDTLNIATRAWRQKGIDSVAGLSRVVGSGTTNYIPKFTASTTVGNSIIQENSGSIGINGAASPDPGDTRLQINGTTYSTINLKSTDITTFMRAHNPLGMFFIGNTSNHGVGILANDAERVRVFANGRVFIGSSPSDAGFQLDVNGSIRAINGGSLATSTGEVLIGTQVDNGNFKLQVGGSGYFGSGTTDNQVLIGFPQDLKYRYRQNVSSAYGFRFDSANLESLILTSFEGDNQQALLLMGDGTFGNIFGFSHSLNTGATFIADFVIDYNGIIGINTNQPNASAQLDVSSTTRGFLPPRMTTTERDAISSPAAGLIIYNTSTSKLQVYTTSWTDLH